MSPNSHRQPTKRERDMDPDESGGPSTKVSRRSGVASREETETSVGQMDSPLLADKFAQSIKRHFPSDTIVALEENYLPSGFFRDTSEFDVVRGLWGLPEYLIRYSEGGELGLTQRSLNPGAPHTLIITSSGIRAADLARAVRRFRSEKSAIAKLFAKHMKLQETVDFLKKTDISIGVGTPARINALLDTQSLRVTELKRVVIDGSYVDSKNRGIWDYEEIFTPLLSLLNRAGLREGFEKGRMQIMVY